MSWPAVPLKKICSEVWEIHIPKIKIKISLVSKKKFVLQNSLLSSVRVCLPPPPPHKHGYQHDALTNFGISIMPWSHPSSYEGRKISASLGYITVRGKGKMEMAKGEQSALCANPPHSPHRSLLACDVKIPCDKQRSTHWLAAITGSGSWRIIVNLQFGLMRFLGKRKIKTWRQSEVLSLTDNNYRPQH